MLADDPDPGQCGAALFADGTARVVHATKYTKHRKHRVYEPIGIAGHQLSMQLSGFPCSWPK